MPPGSRPYGASGEQRAYRRGDARANIHPPGIFSQTLAYFGILGGLSLRVGTFSREPQTDRSVGYLPTSRSGGGPPPPPPEEANPSHLLPEYAKISVWGVEGAKWGVFTRVRVRVVQLGESAREKVADSKAVEGRFAGGSGVPAALVTGSGRGPAARRRGPRDGGRGPVRGRMRQGRGPACPWRRERGEGAVPTWVRGPSGSWGDSVRSWGVSPGRDGPPLPGAERRDPG